MPLAINVIICKRVARMWQPSTRKTVTGQKDFFLWFSYQENAILTVPIPLSVCGTHVNYTHLLCPPLPGPVLPTQPDHHHHSRHVEGGTRWIGETGKEGRKEGRREPTPVHLLCCGGMMATGVPCALTFHQERHMSRRGWAEVGEFYHSLTGVWLKMVSGCFVGMCYVFGLRSG